jgi:squalene-hopene/tetraprenyl-beta-curcumene cyclase
MSPSQRPSTTRRRFLAQSAAVGAALWAGRDRLALAQQDAPDTAAMTAKAVEFLQSRQTEDGQWSPDRKEPGLTALCATALLRSGRVTANDPGVSKALAYLETRHAPDGGMPDAAHANYATALAMLAFQAAADRGNTRYASRIKGGQDFLKRMQWDESESKTPADAFYGGAGYGGRNNRPDLSNTSFMLEALHDTGIPADDPAMQKALVFISRCQNLKTEFNDQPWADKVNDGGFIYTAANGGSSMAGEAPSGGLRSYGGMTYAGLKSMIYAGLSKDDPRVQAALRFIKANYSLDENPGMGQMGLYYYYHTFAKTMAALGQDTLTDASGASHDWRAELTAALAKRQNPDGSWVNSADRFMEGDPNLVTAYALLAIAQARAAAPKS